MADLLAQTARCITRHALIQRGETVVVAVSGGLDSMVLLHLLHRLAGTENWQLVVAHLNHGLRGRASDADERLVRETAGRLKLPSVIDRADVRRETLARKLSLEMAARQLRHEFLARTARARGARVVALAHHADDQVETFLLRLLRGAGGEGLAGMKPVAPSPADADLRLVRPLLEFSRATLAAYARRHRLRFREDASNACRDIPRNRVRHELIPRLRRFQPALDTTILRAMELVGAEAEFATAAAQRWLRHRQRSPFAALAVAVQRRVIQAQLRQLAGEPDFALIEALRATAERRIAVRPGLHVVRDTEGRVGVAPLRRTGFRADRRVVRLTGPRGAAEFGGLRCRWALVAGGMSARRLHPIAGREIFDADRVGGRVVLRHWQPGDRFQPIGLPRAAKLQDLFTNAKVPVAERRDRIVAATARGAIFWVEGLRMSERFKLTATTKRRLIWRWARRSG
ncbi:MAG: tRNA lysidine(34) synthetase TilS [Verrucomicrobiota bacterium]